MAVVVKIEFNGCEDGEVYPRIIRRGETVTGALARATVEGGFAEEEKAKKPERNKMLHTPKNKSLPSSVEAQASRRPTVNKRKKTPKS